jgi:hypothetical protein
MRRKTTLLVLLLLLVMVAVPAAVLAQSTPPGGIPAYTRIGGDGLILYGFTFQQFNEIPWQVYEPTMTVYILDGEFAFYASENPNGKVVVAPPPSGGCVKVRDRQLKEDNEYLFPQETEVGCLQSGGSDCQRPMQLCELGSLTFAQAIILEPGSVLYLPAQTECFICAIEAASGGPALLDITIRSEDENASPGWTSPGIAKEMAPESTPSADVIAGANALRVIHLPRLNPGGCAGRTA